VDGTAAGVAAAEDRVELVLQLAQHGRVLGQLLQAPSEGCAGGLVARKEEAALRQTDRQRERETDVERYVRVWSRSWRSVRPRPWSSVIVNRRSRIVRRVPGASGCGPTSAQTPPQHRNRANAR
jgi:hypothetical protein